jgi:hypothetical protein
VRGWRSRKGIERSKAAPAQLMTCGDLGAGEEGAEQREVGVGGEPGLERLGAQQPVAAQLGEAGEAVDEADLQAQGVEGPGGAGRSARVGRKTSSRRTTLTR